MAETRLELLLRWLQDRIEEIEDGFPREARHRLLTWQWAQNSRAAIDISFLEADALERADVLVADARLLLARDELSLAKKALLDAGAALRPAKESEPEGESSQGA